METPADIVRALSAAGLTEQQIADRLKERGVPVSQATINRIKTGATRRPSFDIGAALVRLHDELRDRAV